MATLKLTEKTIAALPLPTERAQEYYWDTKLTGFGVVVGTTARTFVVRKWVGRKKCKVVIGRQGAVRDDGHRWSVELARKRAQELLGEMASGTNPNAAK